MIETERVVPPVHLVGARWRHHARHSGYGHFACHVGTRFRPVQLPAGGRRAGWAEDWDNTANGILAAAQMVTRRNATFHAVDGDRDLALLSRVAGRRGNRLIATLHNPPSELRRLHLERAIERLHAAILVSRSQHAWLARLLPAERLFVVPHGIDTRFFSPAPSAPAGPAPTLITIGEKLRDFPTLTAALRRVWRRRPGMRLIAVGMPTRGKRLLEGPGVGQVVFLDGITDQQLRGAYRRAHVAVFAFDDATANNSVLEAMACGLPLVVTDVGGVAEYVGPPALLCPRGDGIALADAIESVLDDEPLARKLGAGARARALDYDYQRIGQAMAGVYRTIAAQAR